jgi:hypothetical protein
MAIASNKLTNLPWIRGGFSSAAIIQECRTRPSWATKSFKTGSQRLSCTTIRTRFQRSIGRHPQEITQKHRNVGDSVRAQLRPKNTALCSGVVRESQQSCTDSWQECLTAVRKTVGKVVVGSAATLALILMPFGQAEAGTTVTLPESETSQVGRTNSFLTYSDISWRQLLSRALRDPTKVLMIQQSTDIQMTSL